MEIDSSQPDQHFVAPILGEEAECLIQLNQKLSQLGINNTIKLSSIVVIGDQSTGKSSLIERISQVIVPKKAGLCTRCCIAINLSSGQAWKCSVWVEEAFSYNKSVKPKVTKARPMGPWEPKELTATTWVGETYDRTELLTLIEEAQKLVLNPTRNPQSSKLELFSPNKIRLDISVGNCPNLSFIDMPGTISSLSKDQPDYYVELVSNLASKVASDENNIMLLVLPAVHDNFNSRAYGIIQRQEAQSHTMAVYSKVDCAREEELKDLLSKHFGEEEEEFEHGNHIVMLRDFKGSVANANAAEDDFFSQSPWKDLPDTTRQCFGVANLVNILRNILFRKTQDALPSYVQQINTRIKEVEEELRAMPAPPDTNEIPLLMYHFEQNIRKLFAANEDEISVLSRSKLKNVMDEFKEKIQSDAPTLTIRARGEQQQFDKAKKLIAGSSKNNPAAEDQDSGNESTASPVKTKPKPDRENGYKGPYEFTLDQIEDLNKKHQMTSVPGDIEPKAIEAMHLLSVRPWTESFHLHMQRVSEVVHSQVMQCIRSTFADLNRLPLYKKVKEFTQEYLNKIVQDEQVRLRSICEAETKHPLCSDDARLKEVEEELFQEMRIERNEDRLKVENMVQKSKGLPSNKKKAKEPTIDTMASDPWRIELEMAAKTKAYYQVVTVRFVDTICQQIWAHLVPKIRDGKLVEHVRSSLGLEPGKITESNKAQLASWMSEHPDRENERETLLMELDKLQEGNNDIANFFTYRKQQGSSQAQNVYRGTQVFESALPENSLVPGGENSTFVSPPKRRVAANDDDLNQLESPIKRIKSTPKSHGIGRGTRLPSRSRSVEVVEEMDEDD